MATRIDAGDDLKRQEYFLVNPDMIIVDPAQVGRHDIPTEDKVRRLAINIHTKGQLQPVVCRKVTGGHKLQLVAGYNRHKAVTMLRSGFTHDGVTYHEPDLKLQVVVKNYNDLEAFLANISENQNRNETTPIDDAYNQERLRSVHGWKDGEIAAYYQWAPTKVSQYKKLVQLNPDEQQLVSSGAMAVSTALMLWSLPPDKRAETVKGATGENGKVLGAEVTKQLREHVNTVAAAETESGDPNGRVRKRTGNRPAQTRLSMKEMREGVRKLVELQPKKDDRFSPVITDIFTPFHDFSEGVMTFDQMVNTMKKNLKVWYEGWKEEFEE